MTRSRSNHFVPGSRAIKIAGVGLGLGVGMAVSLPGLSETNPASAASKTTSKSATASKTSTKTPTKTPAKTKTKSTANPKSTVATTAVTGSTGSNSAPPNIVFVLADDMGVDASPCYPAFGTVKPKMPNVEKLCNEGVVFDNMTASPVCSPSRAAALTGKYGFRTNVGNVDDQLSSEETTALDVVASAPIPYANAVIGKWHLAGAQPDPTQPERLGAQYYDGFLRGAVQSYSSWPRVTQGQTNTSSTYTTTALADSAIAWTGKQTKPWLLWLAFNAPHAPFHLPPANLLSNSTLSGAATDITQNPRNYYFAAMEALDTELGRFLQSIPPATRSNTVVLFMGDNGTPARVIQAPFAADTSKGTVAEGGVHVPLIVAGAGVTEKGKRSAALLNGVDVFSTIAELARAKPTAPVDGLSFAGQFSNTSTPGLRTFAYSELFTGTAPTASATATATATGTATATIAVAPAGGNGALRPRAAAGGAGGAAGAAGGNAADAKVWAVRDARYKLVHDVTTGSEELFDLQADPGETTALSVAGPNSEIAAKLKAFVTQLRG
jgi:arylsulfatase B